jgi:4-hydroxyphenylpyruvate dioxygenase
MDKEVKSVEYGLEKYEGAQDFLPLLGTDYVEFYRKRKTISSLL